MTFDPEERRYTAFHAAKFFANFQLSIFMHRISKVSAKISKVMTVNQLSKFSKLTKLETWFRFKYIYVHIYTIFQTYLKKTLRSNYCTILREINNFRRIKYSTKESVLIFYSLLLRINRILSIGKSDVIRNEIRFSILSP